jgi:hypothetical protein
MARKTASKDKKLKMKFKHGLTLSNNNDTGVSTSSPMTNSTRETTILKDEKNESYSQDKHSHHQGQNDECNCFLRKANLFLPASLAPKYDLSSDTDNNSKV